MKFQINYHDLTKKVESCCINLGYLQDIPKTSQHHRQEQRHQHHAENPAITDLIPLRDSQFPYSTICGQRWFNNIHGCQPRDIMPVILWSMKSRVSYLQLSPSPRKICEPCGNPTRHLIKISQNFQNIANQTKPKSVHRLKKGKKEKKNAPAILLMDEILLTTFWMMIISLFIGF